MKEFCKLLLVVPFLFVGVALITNQDWCILASYLLIVLLYSARLVKIIMSNEHGKFLRFLKFHLKCLGYLMCYVIFCIILTLMSIRQEGFDRTIF